MPTTVLICDDSSFARRQMARSIPDGWNVELSFAKDGLQAIELIKQGKADVMFLDLNMPIMDGYQTMEIIKEQDLPTMVIVVSGDIQPEAYAKMMALGALAFIAKPLDNQKLCDILNQYGLYCGVASSQERAAEVDIFAPNNEADELDAYREMANIAMGRAGEQLAKLLGEFIILPIPNVNLITNNEIHMAIVDVKGNASVSAVSQGFIGSGINGEALVLFNDSNLTNIGKLLKYTHLSNHQASELEALMDISNILIGACLNALSEQLHVTFSHNHPIILGRNCDIDQLLDNKVVRWDKILAIEITYSIKSQDIHFDLLLLFPGDAMKLVFKKLVKAST
ncbi:MAG: chemotaxis protein CheY-P-specific phosphatase CheC/ActR [Paraglaciecola sp.]|jgi:chemotaxis protein CheY-P-specific phosphatase CheC/ActR/RegA family two-component response regulator